ncbi:MAG: hypothetical protein U5L45_05230 [Saprospiraceae bacterium]|nr:hypothetical protein [Saprospiraceae bacterium]
MVRFRRSRKRTTFPSLARAKRARDAKNAFRLCPSLTYITQRWEENSSAAHLID